MILLIKIKVFYVTFLEFQLLLLLSLLLLSHINIINSFLFMRLNAKNYGYVLPYDSILIRSESEATNLLPHFFTYCFSRGSWQPLRTCSTFIDLDYLECLSHMILILTPLGYIEAQFTHHR